MRTFTST